MIGIIMFFVALIMLLLGFPVAFTFAGVALMFGIYSQGFVENDSSFIDSIMDGLSLFDMMPFRIFSIMQNTILISIPLFIFMGIILQKTKLAEKLLESMGMMFGEVRGGLAVSTIVVGSFLAASTGVVGASVITMGVVSLPVMLKYGYSKKMATGTICAAGTLGQIIPPSIVLIILGDVVGESVGDLFKAALIPSMVLVGAYITYILVISYKNPLLAPAISIVDSQKTNLKKLFLSIIPTMLLIIVVLGSIFTGIATPTESSAIGGVGAVFLAFLYKEFSFKMLFDSALETVKVTSMVFAILIGATAFSMVFSYSGGDEMVESFLTTLPAQKLGFLIFSMLFIFILGFFIDFVEISFIVIPILYPVAQALDINMIWFAILIALNLQTSFLTPPFGFSLFYLKGVTPPNVKTMDIYKGVIPFIILQILVLLSLLIFPQIYGLEAFK